MHPTLDFETDSSANDRLLWLPSESTTANATMQPTNVMQECISKDESSLLLLNERKCCRICLDEEDEGNDNDDPMIAPCMCKGSSKWVHRSCLDSWRTNEPDRAFAQCTECRYSYHLVASHPQHPSSSAVSQLPAASSFWNQPRMKFCFFVSRDVCTVTLLMQLLIIGLGYIIMLFDKRQHWDLTHLVLNPNSSCYAAASSDTKTTFWCRHNEAAIYYLFGIIALLVIVGIIGSIIFCRNGCTFYAYDEVGSSYEQIDDNTNKENVTMTTVTKAAPCNTSIPATNISDVERGMQQPSEVGVSYHQPPILQPNHMRRQRHSTEYYRRQRHRSSNSNHNCCEACGCLSSGNASSRTSSSSAWSDRCTTTNHFCIYTNSCPCDDPCCDDCMHSSNGGGSNSDDCCCCCNCPGLHHTSSASTTSMDVHNCNCGDGDSPLAIVLFILLVFFVIMAIIGLFLLLVIGVIVCQRIVQRHIFLLQKQTLVQEFQVADLSSLNEKCPICNNQQNNDSIGTNNCKDQIVKLPDTLHPNDVHRLQKLGLLNLK
jgi:RING-variant domain